MLNKLIIKANHVGQFLENTGMEKQKLAQLLNVSPATVSRWVDTKEDSPDPTSTAFLALIPLLLAADVDILPEPDESEVQSHIAMLKSLGVEDSKLEGKEALADLKKQLSSRLCEEARLSRTLSTAMAEAWSKVDEKYRSKSLGA